MRPTWCAILLALGLALGLVLVAGCDRGDESNRERRAPTPVELVSAWAGPKNRVERYTEVAVPGYELFWVSTSNAYGPPGGFGVAVPIDERNFLEGRGALRALLARGVDDPLDAARLALVFLERGGHPLSGARTELHREHGVTPPQREAGMLEFWYERRTPSYVELLRAELDLETLEHRTRSMHVEENPTPPPHGPGARPMPPDHP